MEIITGIERRRRWSVREKLRIVAEAEAIGANYAAVARRHEVSRGLLWHWRKQARLGLLRAEPVSMFVPLTIADEVSSPDPAPTVDTSAAVAAAAAPSPSVSGYGRMEIELAGGHRIRVDRDVDTDALRRVLTILAPR